MKNQDIIPSDKLMIFKDAQLENCEIRTLSEEEAGKLLYNMAVIDVLSNVLSNMSSNIKKNDLIMNKYFELYSSVSLEDDAIICNKNYLNFPLSKQQLIFESN